MFQIIGQWIVLAVVSYLLRPDPPSEPKPATFEQYDVPIANEGQELAVLFGTRDIKNSNVPWYGDLKRKAVRNRS